MAKKVYAVKRGRETGLFSDWETCRAQVEGFPGAVHKGFETPEEARAWLWGTPSEEEPASLFDAEAFAPPPPKKRAAARREKTELPGGDADYIVYTDGSCLRNPDGPGGYAAIILPAGGGEATELSGGEPSTTNNRMELRAGIAALSALPEGATVEFYTDSQYMRNAFTKNWLASWKRHGWLTAAGTPVKNRDLWLALDEAFQRHRVRFHWVKGHAGNRWNERCDALARDEAQRFL